MYCRQRSTLRRLIFGPKNGEPLIHQFLRPTASRFYSNPLCETLVQQSGLLLLPGSVLRSTPPYPHRLRSPQDARISLATRFLPVSSELISCLAKTSKCLSGRELYFSSLLSQLAENTVR